MTTLTPTLLLALLLAGAGQAPPPAAPPPRATAGLNLPMPSYYDVNKWSVDCARTLRAWVPFGGATTLATTADGYPLAPATALGMLVGYPVGTYTLRFRGTATITVSGRGSSIGPVTQGPDGISRADITLSATTGGLTLKATGLDPADPLADLHLIRPGYDPADPPMFTDDFLRRVKLFACLRLMDWGRTNTTRLVHWADRPKPTDFCWTDPSGVPYEAMVALANAVHRDLWICVPDQATDDFIKSLADLIVGTLNPGLNLYVEFSNELWNSFPQGKRLYAQAMADPAAYPKGAAQLAAAQLHRVATIFRAEFGASASRVRPVLCGQTGSSWWVATGLQFLQAQGIDVAADLYGIGIAPYPQVLPAANVDGLTVDQIFAGIADDMARKIVPGITAHATLAQQFGVKLLAYEGGQSLVTLQGKAGDVNGPSTLAAQTDPRMGDLYRSLRAAWQAADGDVFCYYNGPAGISSEFGSWGALTSQDQPGSVKWDTLLGFVLPAGDVTLDGVCDYSDYLLIASNVGTPGPLWREQGDLTGDGLVDAADVAAWRAAGPALSDAQRSAVAAPAPGR